MTSGQHRPIGAVLRDLRESAGRSQNEQADLLSDLAGRVVTRNEVSRWEREARLPTPFWQAPLAASFGVSVDLIRHGVARTRATKRLADGGNEPAALLRPSFARASAGDLSAIDLGRTPQDFLAGITVETPAPTRIGWAEVEHVRATTNAVAMSENLFGGGLSCEAALAQLQWASGLLKAEATDNIRDALLETVGNLSSVVAYSAFDIANYESADRCFRFSLWCADEGNSWSLRANTLAEMARKAAYLGDLDNALSLIEFAQVRSDRLTATARAMLWTMRARLLAVTGRADEARSDVTRADEQFAERDPGSDPPWLCYYDEAEHQGSTGKALIPVAREMQSLGVAAPRLEKAIELQGDHYLRSRTFSTIRLASLLMDISDPDTAVTLGRAAVENASGLRSNRIVAELQGLARAAKVHQGISDVADLRHDIVSLDSPPT